MQKSSLHKTPEIFGDQEIIISETNMKTLERDHNWDGRGSGWRIRET